MADIPGTMGLALGGTGARDAAAARANLGAAPTVEPEFVGPVQGDASIMSVTPSATGAQPYGLAERAADEVSVMHFIPANLRASVRAGTNATDLTTYIRAALATGKSVRFPVGRYRITDYLSLVPGQRMLGESVVRSVLVVDASFNMSAPAVISVATGDSSGWDGIGIEFDQTGATNRATLRQYPWALDIRTATRFKIGTLRLSGAWNGIRGDGNCGGLDAGLLEIGAFNKGLLLDGLLDFAHINSLHLWPFDFAGNSTLMAIHRDGTTIGAEFGLIDGLDVKSLNTFGPSVISNANGNTGAARQIGMLQLDGDFSNFVNTAGDWQIGLVSTTKSGGAGTAVPAFSVSSGAVTVASMRTWGATQAPTISVTGGILNILGGSFEQLRTDHPAAEVSGGTLMVSNTRLAPIQGGDRSTGFLRQTGAGVLKARSNVASTSGTGPLISVATDLPGHTISDNDFNGFSYTLPAGARLGVYGPNKVAPFAWTPQLATTTPGTMSATWTVQTGRYWYTEDGIRFEGRLTGSMNAFTDASGALRVSGLPVIPSPAQDDRAVTLGAIGGLTLPAGRTGLNAIISAVDGQMYFPAYGSGVTPGFLDQTSIPSGGGAVTMTFAGDIPTR